MDSRSLIDAQFHRAVEIVQGLPKNGPVQTDYDEKLTMYSLYKQATNVNVKAPRPGIWDMLGRAKWDAWAKHKDLDPYEARWLYVEALLKVLRKYSDKTIARDLVQELESYGGDPANMVLSRTLSKSVGSGSSGSTASDEPAPPPPLYSRGTTSVPPLPNPHPMEEPDSGSEEDSEEDEARELPNLQSNRPQSSLSSQHRYRTPMGASFASPPPLHTVPSTQPLPAFETPSAFAEPISTFSGPSSLYQPTNSYPGQFSEAGLTSPQSLYPPHAPYRTQSQPGRQYGPLRPPSRPTIERALENIQAHLAALHERVEVLETSSAQPHRSNISLPPSRGSPTRSGLGLGGSPPQGRAAPDWDLDDLGMWSLVLNPLSRGVASAREFAAFFARNENRSPTLIIVRRLCLDVSFLVCVLALIRAVWRRSGMRRREVRFALVVLWRALLGVKKERVLVDRGV